MTARNYTINDVVQGIFPDGVQDTLTIYNTSATDILYLNEHPDYNGFALGAGSTMTWDAKRALYMYAPSGKTIVASVIDNGGSIFPAGAIASQILQQGLATQIANAITLNGVPSIDPFTALLAISNPFIGGSGDYLSAWISCANYQSLVVNIKDVHAVARATPLPRQWAIYWYDKNPATGGILIGYDAFQSVDNNNTAGGRNEVTFHTPTRGAYFLIQGVDNGLTTTAQIRVSGSYKAREKPFYIMPNQFAGTAGAGNVPPFPSGVDRFYYSEVAPKVAAAAVTDWPHVVGGWAVVTVTASAVTAAGSVAIADVNGGSAVGSGEPVHAFFALPIAAGIQSQTARILVPYRALQINHSAALAATNVRVTIAYEGN
ncbi:MAG TPA: hypothetical protein VIY48_02435 [Candidatus Paceibacterota bacterium]|jgi:hypothetical protein